MTELESRTVCIDLDDTLCTHSGDYAKADPIPGAQEALTKLRKAGWCVVVYTGRHFNQWQVTVDWLACHGFEYDQIVFGKPPARFYIDDRAIRFDGNWDQVCRELVPAIVSRFSSGCAPTKGRS
jgi:trehalose-6-phosphatase